MLPVVLVHRNRPDRLVKTVDAFLGQEGVDVRVTVVDNGSPVEVLAELRRVLPPEVEVLSRGTNTGFGPAANVGFRRWLDDPAAPAWIALAPHDALPAPDALSRLVAASAARPRAGLACADFGDGATPVVDPYFGGILAAATVAEGWDPAGHPHGTLMLAGRACLLDVGLFDERYFAYCEEADLGVRARAAGWECGLVRGAMVENPDLGSTAPAVDYLQQRNTLYLVRQHSGRYHAFIRFNLAALQLGAGLVSPRRRDPYWHVEGKVRGMADFVRGRFGPPPADLLVHR